MPADPIELQIVEAIRTRLAAITTDNGYHTDAGNNVRLGRPVDPDNDPPIGIVLWLDTPAQLADDSARGDLRWRLTVNVAGYIKTSDEDPLADTIKLASDIKKAIYDPEDLALVASCEELTFGAVEHFPPEEDTPIAGVVVPIIVPYVETLTG